MGISRTKCSSPCSANKAFVGGVATADWGEDYTDDVVYFGTIEEGATFEDQSGDIYRFLPSSNAYNMLMDVKRPITATPLPVTVDNKNFVYVGTGRYLVQEDANTDDLQYYLGIIEDESGFNSLFDLNDLLDVTTIEIMQNYDASGNVTSVEADNAVFASDIDPSGDDTVTTFEELSEYILDGHGGKHGWYRRFGYDYSIKERVVSDADYLYPILSWATFVPNDHICEPEVGTSYGYVVDLVTGTASELAPLQDDPASGGSGGEREAQYTWTIGGGFPSDTVIIQNEEGDAVVLNGTSEGAVSRIYLELADNVSVRRINWREIIQ